MTRSRAPSLVLAISLYLSTVPLVLSQPLHSYTIDQQYGITVSGVSAGAAMAIQMHVAYSRTISGIAGLAGPPYWCAMDDIAVALNACMAYPEYISLDLLWDGTSAAYAVDSIDDPTFLAKDRVWLFSGTNDTVVHHKVVEKTSAYYQKYIPAPDNFFVGTIDAEHAWITNNYGNECNFLGSPYINNCGFDASGHFLNFLYPHVSFNPKGANNATNLLSFSQDLYTPLEVPPATLSLAEKGFVYVPLRCQQGHPCKMHMVLHGCNQGYSAIGDTFVVHNGMNEWAETNDFIILYPQVDKSDLPYNPMGCFDWWGYTGTAYATQLGPQMRTLSNMLTALGAK